MATKKHKGTKPKSHPVQHHPKVLQKRHRWPALVGALISVLAAVMIGVQALGLSHGLGSATLTMTPSTGGFETGRTFETSIAVDSGTEPIGSVRADITYPTDKLQYVGTGTTDDSQFNDATPNPTITNGVLSISRSSQTPRTGSSEFVTITFKVKAAGDATITIANTSAIYRSSDAANLYGSSTGASYNLADPAPATDQGSDESDTGSDNTGDDSDEDAAGDDDFYSDDEVYDDSEATGDDEVFDEESDSLIADPEEAIGDDNPIIKAEYFLDGKLLKSFTHDPFTYELNTGNLLNGTYIFTTTLHYQSGEVKTSKRTVIVKNPAGFKQMFLAAQHNPALSGTVIALLIAFPFIFTRLIHRFAVPRFGSGHHFGTAIATPSIVVNDFNVHRPAAPTAVQPTQPAVTKIQADIPVIAPPKNPLAPGAVIHSNQPPTDDPNRLM